MPGITGIIGLQVFDGAEVELTTMLGRLAHDSSMVKGLAREPSLGLQVGWVAHPSSDIPPALAWNERRDLGIIFSGDEYVATRGTASTRPLAHLLSLYERDGVDFLASLNGTFCGLILDLRARKVVLFNDRFGLSRLYVHDRGPTFYFSSEAKSLLAVQPALRRIDPRGLAELISIGCVLQDRSLFEGVSLLPPGAAWTFHASGQRERHRYFEPRIWEDQPKLDAATYQGRLIEIFRSIAPRYYESKAPIGMSLTGGLDSRMLLAWSPRPAGTLPCYTFGGPYRDCADVVLARELARVCGQPHTTIPISQAFFDDFASLARRTIEVTDGAMDVSGAVELFVNQRARTIAPIRLTGNYGSEILRSNVAFRPARMDTSVFTPDFAELIRLAAETYRQEADCHRLTLIAFKQVPWHHYARRAVEYSQLVPRSPFLDNELVALAYQAPAELATSTGPLLELIAAGNPALSAVQTDRALRQSRVPLLSSVAKAWQEFTVKAEYAYDYGMPPLLTKFDRAFRSLHFERLFLGRHKFYHFRVWYRDQLSGYLRSLDSQLNGLPAYRDGAARQLVEEHVSGRVNHTTALHKLVSVKLITEVMIGAR